MFSLTPITTNGYVEDPLHGLHACQIWILQIFTCGDTYHPLCMQLLLTTKSHFTIILWMPETISNYPHLWMDVAVHDETCWNVHWILLHSTFWALQVYSFSYNSQINCVQTHADTDIFLFWYVGLMSKVWPQLSFTSCIMYNDHWFSVARIGQRNLVTYLGKYCHIVCVTIDGVWIGDSIYWPLIHTTRNYKQLQHHY
jgi:hypothetical protein